MKIHAATRLKAYDPTWVPKMEHKTELKYHGEPKPQMLKDEQIFKLAPSALAQRLKALYGPQGYAEAMGALTAYKNRAGKSLLTPDKDRLEQAKQQLRKTYGRDETEGAQTPRSTKPANPSKPANDGKPGKPKPPVGSRPSGHIV
jgi:hypothetical protein